MKCVDCPIPQAIFACDGEREREKENFFLSSSEKEKRDNIAYLKEKEREVVRDWLTESIGGWMIAELFHPLHRIDEHSLSLTSILSSICVYSALYIHILQ
jgi:hypothetical protein